MEIITLILTFTHWTKNRLWIAYNRIKEINTCVQYCRYIHVYFHTTFVQLEFIGHRWIPPTKGQWYRSLICFHISLNKLLNKESSCWWFETAWRVTAMNLAYQNAHKMTAVCCVLQTVHSTHTTFMQWASSKCHKVHYVWEYEPSIAQKPTGYRPLSNICRLVAVTWYLCHVIWFMQHCKSRVAIVADDGLDWGLLSKIHVKSHVRMALGCAVSEPDARFENLC